MNDHSHGKPPVSFWVISIVALVWNLMGVYAYLNSVYMSEEAFAAYTEEQQTLMEAVPSWVTGAFAIAVFAGALGCIALLLRKKWATTLFVLSLIGIIAQQFYNFFIAKMHTVMGGTAVVMSLVVLIVAIVLVYLSKFWTAKGLLK